MRVALVGFLPAGFDGVMRAYRERKADVAFDVRFDFGRVDAIDEWCECCKDLRAADNRDLSGILREVEHFVNAVRRFDTGRIERPVARQHDVAAQFERFADRGERFPAHDHRFADGQCLEMLQVGRQMPRQRTVAADDTAAFVRDDEDYPRALFDVRPLPLRESADAVRSRRTRSLRSGNRRANGAGV